jgi:hypothetical protein
LQLLSVLGKIQQQEPAVETLQQIKERCRDSAVSIRKQSMACLTELLQSFPNSKRTVMTWAATIPSMIADTEQSIQEKAMEYFEQIVFGRLKEWEKTENGDPALWFLATRLDFGADVTNATRRICHRISKKSSVPKKILATLQTAVDTKEFKDSKELRVL